MDSQRGGVGYGWAAPLPVSFRLRTLFRRGDRVLGRGPSYPTTSERQPMNPDVIAACISFFPLALFVAALLLGAVVAHRARKGRKS